ncbi:MAG: ACT domain-containing protein, partial [Nitrospinaceae bacterium]|nr:ACT domain-containing protein [Nitrospinaceae bacterium]
LVDAPLTSIEVQYNGEVAEQRMDPITISVLKGLLSRTIDGINMVNAPFIVKDRDIEVKESKSSEVHEYTSTIQVTAKTQKGERSVTGSIFGKGDSRIVKFDEFHFEAVLSEHMLVLNNTDVPGVIGNLGNVLGTNNINIAGFHLGRIKEGDKAVAIINIDSPPTSETIRAIREIPSILNVHTVTL